MYTDRRSQELLGGWTRSNVNVGGLALSRLKLNYFPTIDDCFL